MLTHRHFHHLTFLVKKFPKAQQTQVVPKDQPVMQECWQQKELMAPRLPKLNIVICKSQSNLLLLQRLLHDIRQISVASQCLTTKRLLRVMLFRSAVFKKCIYIWASIARYPPPPHPMVMGLHSSAPVPLPPSGGGGGGWWWWKKLYMYVYECICMV